MKIDANRDRTIPVSIITGFLGSGKTTLLSKLLADPRMSNTAIIINEFGEMPLDHLLVTKPKEDVMLLSSGCICCTLRGELVDTLALLYAERERGEIPKFDRVLVETTGLAEPAPILMSIVDDEAMSRLYRLECVVTTVDSVAGLGQLADHPESIKQACVADVVLLTKSDLAGGQQDELRAEIGSLNSLAKVVAISNGDIDPAHLFDIEMKAGAPLASRWFTALGDGARREAGGEVRGGAGSHSDDHDCHRHDHDDHRHGHDHRHHHHEHRLGTDIESFVAILEEPVTASGLQIWAKLLSGFHGPNLLRIKGIVNLEGHPVVLQAVQHMFYPLADLPEWPDGDRRTRLVFIVKDLPREKVEQTLEALTIPMSKDQVLSQAAFDRFASVAATFR